MNPEKQRIKIAEACGWVLLCDNYKQQNYRDVFVSTISGPVGLPPTTIHSGVQPAGGIVGGSNGDAWYVPDYINDLNASNEAEMYLSDISPGKDERGNVIPSDRARYRLELCIICTMRGGPIHATAAQRSEAFLKTLKLWDNE